MESKDALFLLKRHITELQYHWGEINDLMEPLEILTKEALQDYNPKLIRSFIGYENEPALQVYFRNEKDLKNANELLKDNKIVNRIRTGWGNQYYKYFMDISL